jgi:hypothetical protein
MLNNSLLLNRIESLRKQMNMLARKHSYTSKKIINISTELDALLNKYNKSSQK